MHLISAESRDTFKRGWTVYDNEYYSMDSVQASKPREDNTKQD